MTRFKVMARTKPDHHGCHVSEYARPFVQSLATASVTISPKTYGAPGFVTTGPAGICDERTLYEKQPLNARVVTRTNPTALFIVLIIAMITFLILRCYARCEPAISNRSANSA